MFIFAFMKTLKFIKIIPFFALLGLFLQLSACSSESSSSSEEATETLSSSSTEENISSETEENDNKGSSSSKEESSNQTTPSSSSAIQETVSGQEALNEPQQKINGTCSPVTGKINKGELASWQFFRNEGEVWDQILAPFVWVFNGASTDTVQGNGLNQVNLRYENSGTYGASLWVDGNTIVCDSLQVQGVPIIIDSCKANSSNVTAGETITWTVYAQSESPIESYSWSSEFGEVTANGVEASLLSDGSMHKKNVIATVNVTNKDKTTESYACDPVTVVDPNQVDVMIAHSGITDSTKQAFAGGQTLVAQYPSNAVNCQLVCGAQGNGVLLEVDGETFTIDYSLNITPAKCTNGAAAGTKITVTASMNVYCYVTY